MNRSYLMNTKKNKDEIVHESNFTLIQQTNSIKNVSDFENELLKEEVEEKSNIMPTNSNPIINHHGNNDEDHLDSLPQKEISPKRKRSKSFRSKNTPKEPKPKNENI